MRWLTAIGMSLAFVCPAPLVAQQETTPAEKPQPGALLEKTFFRQANLGEEAPEKNGTAQPDQEAAKKAVDLAVRKDIDWLSRQQCASCHFHVPKQAAAFDAMGNKLAFTASDTLYMRQVTGKSAALRLLCSRNAEKKESVTYLGVSLAAVPEVVRRHVSLPVQMGLLVETVDAGSPAQTAGLAQHDVLVKIDEQLLVNPEQFSVLIRTYQPEAEVRLLAIQQNEQKTLIARLARREVAQREGASGEWRVFTDVSQSLGYSDLQAVHAKGNANCTSCHKADVHGTTPRGHGVAWADFDRDGAVDLLVANSKGAGAYSAFVKQLEAAAAPRKKAIAYLGVHTAAPAEALAKQLKLAPGTGLMIETVEEDTAAAKAGLKAFDVLQKLDEQILINADQLTTLIRAHKPGDEIRLTLIREGKRLMLLVALGQREIEVAASEPVDEFAARLVRARPHGAWEWKQPHAAWARWWSAAGDNPAAESTTDAEFLRRAYLDLMGVPPRSEEVKTFIEDARLDKRKRLIDGLIARPEGISRASGSTAVKWSDSAHTLSLVSKDGNRQLSVQDSQGKTLFEGPVGTDDERKAVPRDVAEKLAAMLRAEAGREPAVAGPQDLLARVLPRVELAEVPLKQAFEQLCEETGANLVVNWKALKQAGVNADEPVSLSLKDVRLSTVLTTLLTLAGDDKALLGFSVEGEVILISVQRK